MQLPTLIACILALVGLVRARSSMDPLCNKVAVGSYRADFDGDECTISCHIQRLGLGLAFKAHHDWGDDCEGGRCVLGECRKRDYIPPEDLSSYEIRIKRARVVGADEVTATDSDPFVVVTLYRGSSSTFASGTPLCLTHTIWHEADPVWDFSCRQVALEPEAELKFSVYDQDSLGQDFLGEVTEKVSRLVKHEECELRLTKGYGGNSYQTLTVQVIKRKIDVGNGKCHD